MGICERWAIVMENKPIKKILDEMYGVTDEDIRKIILEQKVEEEEEKVNILKELIKYKSFEDYVRDHKKEFEMVDISDDFSAIIISEEEYPNIHLDLLKKMRIIADHFGLFIHIVHKNHVTTKKFDKFRRKEKI